MFEEPQIATDVFGVTIYIKRLLSTGRTRNQAAHGCSSRCLHIRRSTTTADLGPGAYAPRTSNLRGWTLDLRCSSRAGSLARVAVAGRALAEVLVATLARPIPEVRRAPRPIAPTSTTEVHVPALLGVFLATATTCTEKILVSPKRFNTNK